MSWNYDSYLEECGVCWCVVHKTATVTCNCDTPWAWKKGNRRRKKTDSHLLIDSLTRPNKIPTNPLTPCISTTLPTRESSAAICNLFLIDGLTKYLVSCFPLHQVSGILCNSIGKSLSVGALRRHKQQQQFLSTSALGPPSL